MKRKIVIATVAAAFLVGVIGGCKKDDYSSVVGADGNLYSPAFQDGTRLKSTDKGKTWQPDQTGNNCRNACGCATKSGVISGTCLYDGQEIRCSEYCNPGK